MHPFTSVIGPSAWYADQYKNSSEHIYDLSPQDLAELDAAVAAVLQSSKDIQASLVPDIYMCSLFVHKLIVSLSFWQKHSRCPVQ